MTDDWRAEARCNAQTARLFDPLGDADRTRRETVPSRFLAAIAICRICPVRTPCLEAAFAHRDSGIRGGLYIRNGQIDWDVTDRTDRRAVTLAEVPQ